MVRAVVFRPDHDDPGRPATADCERRRARGDHRRGLCRYPLDDAERDEHDDDHGLADIVITRSMADCCDSSLCGGTGTM